MLVDDMDDTVATAYHAWPDRLFILAPGGRVAYRGERGPRGFHPEEMESALQRLLAETHGPEETEGGSRLDDTPR